MNKKPRPNRAITLFFVFICVAIVFAGIWGIVSGFAKLMHYGENTTIQQDPAALAPEPPLATETTEPPMEEEVLEKNTYSADGFYEIDGIRFYHGGDYEGVAGIDVSAYQTEIDWEKVKSSGVEFAMIRVGYRGYTTGNLDLDDCFHAHIKGALEAGLDVGVYFFSQSLTPEEAVEEAEYVVEQIKEYEISYPVVYDWEEVQGPARTDEMNMLMLTSCAMAFCETIEKAGYEAGVYFNQTYGYEQFNLVSLKDYVFWLAEYDPVPSFVYNFQIWQYTNEGAVPGIEGPVDLNICFRKRTA